MKRTLGVCYYPEHWPEDQWAEDAARMIDTGLAWVRIGEFAWGRIEAIPGILTWDWLDRAVEVLGADTPTQQIMRVALDNDGWPVGDPVMHIDLRGTDFRPDGAVCDVAGNMWNAQWGTARIAGYRPDGTFITAHNFPADQTTCPAFGGDDLTTLFCTSAAVGLAEDDAQGKTFAIETDITGQKEHQVIL